MMIPISLLDVIPILGYLALIYAGGPLAALALLLLAVPACRRVTALRWIGCGLLACVGGLALCAMPMLQEIWSEHAGKRAFERATHTLTVPQTFAGVAFPAGSIVHVNEASGRPEFGTVPVPTLIAGLMLSGNFRLEREYLRDADTIAEGTLAVPTVIHGIPCGRGILVAQDEVTRCILDRDYDFTGHLLAGGQGIEIYRSPLDEPAQLRWGTLARPELLFDVTWPAGSVIGGGITLPPERMAHGFGADGSLQACLPKGLELHAPWAVLHGLMGLTIQGDRLLVSQVCSILPGEPVDLEAYAEVGAAHYGSGERTTRDAAWVWSDPVAP